MPNEVFLHYPTFFQILYLSMSHIMQHRITIFFIFEGNIIMNFEYQ